MASNIEHSTKETTASNIESSTFREIEMSSSNSVSKNKILESCKLHD